MPDGDKIPFDYLGAKKAGYSDQEIQSYLKDKYSFGFDIMGAKNSGYSDGEIADYITKYEAPVKKKETTQEQFGIPLPVFKNGGTNGSSVVSSGGSDLIPTGKAEEQPQQAEQPYDIKDPVKSELAPFRKKATEDYQHLQSFGEFNPYGGSESTRQRGNQRTLPINARNDERYQAEVKQGQSSSQLHHATDVAYSSFFKNGKVAKEFLQKEYEANNGQLDQNNETLQLAAAKAQRFEALKEKAKNKNINELAIDLARENSPYMDKLITELEKGQGIEGYGDYYKNVIPNAMQGRLVDELANDPDMKVVGEDDPKIKAQLDDLKNNIYKYYPEYGKTKVRNILSQEYERRRSNLIANPIFNKSDYLNKLSDETFKDNPQLKEIADQMKGHWQGELNTSGLVDEFASGASNTVKGMGESIKDAVGLGDTHAERIYKGLEQEYSHVDSGVKGWKKDLGTAANFGGMITAMAAGGVPLKGLGLSPAAINATITADTFYDNELNKYSLMYPGEQWKARAGALLSTAAYASVAKAFPSTKLADAVSGKLAPEIESIVSNLNKEAVGKELVKTAAQKLGDVLKKTASGTAEATGHMIAVTTFQKALDDSFGIDPEANKKYHPDSEILDVARNMVIGSAFPQAVIAIGNRNAVGKSLLSAAEFPERSLSALDVMKTKGVVDEAEYDKKLEDVKYLNNLNQYLKENEITPKNKARFLLEAMNEKYKKESIANAPESIARKEQGEIKASQYVQDKILNGEDVVGAEEKKSFTEPETKAIDAIKNKDLSGTALDMYGKIISDENASPDQKKMALREISDQLLATGTAEKVGTILGKDASLAIEDLGHEAPKESEALQQSNAGEMKSVLERPIEGVSIDDILSEIHGLSGEQDVAAGKGDYKDIGDYVNRAKTVIQKLYPKASLEVYPTSKEYEQAGATKGSRGFSVYDKNGQHKVLLNIEAMAKTESAKTAFHEAIHPIVYDKYGVNTDALKKTWNTLAEQMKGVKGMDKVFSHLEKYAPAKHAPEGITELLTQVAQGNIDIKDIPAERQSRIIELINKLFEHLGIDFRLKTADDFSKFAKEIKTAFETSNVEGLKETMKGKRVDKYFSEYEKAIANDADPEKLKQLHDLLDKKIKSEIKSGRLSKENADKIYAKIRTTENPIEKTSVSIIQPEENKVADIIPLKKANETTEIPIEAKAESGATQTTNQDQPATGEGSGEPPLPSENKPIESEKPLGNKSLAVRLVDAQNVPEAAKEGIRGKGLNYEPQSQKEAEDYAKGIIDEIGIDEAVINAQAQKFGGDVNTLVQTESLNRLAEMSDKETDPAKKADLDKKFAEVGIGLDEWLRKQGRGISAVNYFYKKSPLGIQLMENTKRKQDFEDWAKPKDKSWKEVYDEMMKEPEFEKIFKEQVKEGMKQERAEARKTRIKKVDDFIDKAKDQFKGGATYSTIIPPQIITTALEGIRQAYYAGEHVVKIVQDAIDYISKELGHDNWDKDKFKKEWEEKLKEPTGRNPLTDEELKLRLLDKFRNKLKGLSDKQKEDVVRKSFAKIVESGGLDYQDFRDIIADVTGRGKMTDAEAAKLKQLVKETNAVDEAGKRAREERTQESRKDYREAEIKAGAAAKELNTLLYNKPNITKRLTSLMQLNTLGIPALINNPIYNVINHLGIRLPVGLIKTGIERAIQGGSALAGKEYLPETDVLSVKVQKEFFNKLGLGTRESVKQFLTGLNRMDYLNKEIQGQQIRPATAIRDLWSYSKGEKNLTKAQVIDKIIQASPPGITAEIIARTLNLGDKPQRFAAEGSQAAAFAKSLGLKDIDYDLFIDFPREEAYRAYKAKGLSDEEAGKKADYVKDTIIKEGERSTFQQDNMLNDMLNRVFGGQSSGVGGLIKATVVSPYIKIPSNAYWSYYNIVNPEVAMLQSMIYAGKAFAKTKGVKFSFDKPNSSAAKDLHEAKYWLAHAAVGMATRAAIIAMVSAGIYRSGNTGDDTKKEREGEQFYENQGTMNLSKLMAWLRGEDPNEVKGGLLISDKWAGHWGTVGNTIARKFEDMTPEQKKQQGEFWDAAIGNMELYALQDFEQGVFGNTQSLLSSMQQGIKTGNVDSGLQQWGLNTLNMFTNIVHPAASAQIEKAFLPYYTKAKADTFMQEVKNSMLTRSAVLRKVLDQYPPAKIGIWGDRLDKKDNVAMRLFGISRANDDNFAQPIYEDYKKTNDIGFFPPAVTPELNGKKLNSEQTAKLEEYIGSARKSYVAPYINDAATLPVFNKKYSALSGDEKKKVLSYLYEQGRYDGIAKFAQDYPEFEKAKKDAKKIVEDVYFEAFKTVIKYKK